MISLLASIGAILIGASVAYSSRSKAVHVPSKSAVLVTGSSRGIGKTLALELAALGYTVFGSVRSERSAERLSQEAPDNLDGKVIPVIFDVTKDQEVEEAVKTIKKEILRQDLTLIGIVNNAGINPEGEAYAEVWAKTGSAPEDVLADSSIGQKVLETNVIGVVRTTRAFLPLLLSSPSSRVVMIGSYFGTIAGGLGLSHLYYEASKFALEGLSDGMRRSLKSKGVLVSLVKPGNIITDMNAVGESPASCVSRDVIHALENANPRPRYYPGKVKGYPVRLLCALFDTLPSWMTDKLVG